jgi:uncharacterized membrane protein
MNNLDNLNLSNIFSENDSIVLKILLVFYILVGSSLMQPLLSKQWVALVEDNRIIQHIIGIVTLIALVTLLSEGKLDNITILMYSLMGYLWFIFSTKLDVHWNIMIMILLVVAYLYENSTKQKNKLIDSDKILTEEEKNKIKSKNSTYSNAFIVCIMLVTVFGAVMYSNKKEVQYGGGYSLINFLLY